ncbi:MAG: hypothetical protein M0Q51_09680 [Bacteroidales bacterium]|nr:hypothetical protein [Bacteroidales bacterium]
MGHHETDESISPAEKQFRELMYNGDDFFKIEIYRNAVKYYKDAAKLDVDKDLANQKVAECELLLRHERKVIYILLSIAAVTVILIWLI